MDADLAVMASIPRFWSCVDCLLAPLLAKRRITEMPCKHRDTFERSAAARRAYYEDAGWDYPGDDVTEPPPGYCDCHPFDRRAALWEVGEMCLKFSLTRTQMRELSVILQYITHHSFTYNHAKRAMHDMFGGKYHDFLKDLKRKRKAVMRKRKAAFEDGASFEEAAVWLVAKWQHRMMPNI